MKKILFVLLAVTFFCLSACSSSGNPDAERAAVSVALDWLALIDGGMYGESWDVAAEKFKKDGSRKKWGTTLKMIRDPRGKALSREVQTARYKTRLPGATVGQYVVVKFDTVFEKKESSVETVITVMNNSGKWQVTGYALD